MLFNRHYGNFGMLVMPFGLAAFCAGIYTALYMAYRLVSTGLQKIGSYSSTGIPLHLPQAPELTLFYINTNTMMFVVAAVLLLSLAAIYVGNKIAESRLTAKAFFAYFAFFGLLAPLWLIRAAWGAALARESAWR